MSRTTYSDTLIHLEAIKRIFVGGPRIDFFPTVSPGFLVKIDQILKWGFFARLCP